MDKIAESELIINEDGSIFHLHLKPNQIANRIILVGDPDRVNLVASHFQTVECDIQNREFRTVTGFYQGKRISVISTGIGCDNIDIVINELDALANIDFETRTIKPQLTNLQIVRIGTCGGLQPDTPLGTFIASVKSIGFDGLLNYYADRDTTCDLALEKAFVSHMNWSKQKGAPYVATANQELLNRIAGSNMYRGITIACGGFYGPQGRQLRLKVQDPIQNQKIESFRYIDNGIELKIANFEMESSALSGLSAILGHKALTCCIVIANRHYQQMNTNYKQKIDDLITTVLKRF